MRVPLITWMVAAVLVVPVFTPASGFAQEYPSRYIRFVVTSGAGSAPDLCARVVGQALSERIKQPVVVENKVGGNGTVAVDAVVQAPADGYTFLVTHAAAISSNPHLSPKTGMKALTDLTAVTKLADTDFGFAVKSSLGVNSVQEFIALAKAKPGQLNFATSSIGSLPNLSAELFRLAAGLQYEIIPHAGGAASVSATAMQQTDAVIEAPSVMIPFQQNGQLKIIARTGAKRTDRFPDLPTLKESGVDMITSGWIALMAKKGTPDGILDFVQAKTAEALRDATVVERLKGMSFEAIGDSRQEFEAEWKKESAVWKNVIEKANIKVE